MVNASAYFDLYDTLVNEVVGGLELFLILGIILIFLVCRKMGVTYYGSLLFTMIFVSIIVATTYNPAWWALTLLIVGLIFYMGLSNKLRG